MSFWQGVAKAVGEISAENNQRRAVREEREFVKEQRAIERENKLADIEDEREYERSLITDKREYERGEKERELQDKNDKLLRQLEFDRKLSERQSSTTIKQANDVLKRVGVAPEGEDQAPSNLVTAIQNFPSVAVELQQRIEEVEEKLGRSLTPEEINSNFKVFTPDDIDTEMPEDLTPEEQVKWFDAMEEMEKNRKATIIVRGDVFKTTERTDLELPEARVTADLVTAAEEQLSTPGLAASDVQKLRKQVELARKGDAAGLRHLVTKTEFGNQILLRAIQGGDVEILKESPALGPLITTKIENLKTQFENLKKAAENAGTEEERNQFQQAAEAFQEAYGGVL